MSRSGGRYAGLRDRSGKRAFDDRPERHLISNDRSNRLRTALRFEPRRRLSRSRRRWTGWPRSPRHLGARRDGEAERH